MTRRHGRDWGFFKWFAAGFLVVFGLITQFTIGLPFLVLGAFLFVHLWRRGPGWPADLGLVAGAGAVCLGIAAINLLSGELSPAVWAAVGFALTAVGTVGLLVAALPVRAALADAAFLASS
jgi:hypothetical protein